MNHVTVSFSSHASESLQRLFSMYGSKKVRKMEYLYQTCQLCSSLMKLITVWWSPSNTQFLNKLKSDKIAPFHKTIHWVNCALLFQNSLFQSLRSCPAARPVTAAKWPAQTCHYSLPQALRERWEHLGIVLSFHWILELIRDSHFSEGRVSHTWCCARFCLIALYEEQPQARDNPYGGHNPSWPNCFPQLGRNMLQDSAR